MLNNFFITFSLEILRVDYLLFYTFTCGSHELSIRLISMRFLVWVKWVFWTQTQVISVSVTACMLLMYAYELGSLANGRWTGEMASCMALKKQTSHAGSWAKEGWRGGLLTMIPAQWGVSLASREELMATMRKATPAIAIPSRSCNRATSKGKRQPQQIWASSVTGPLVPAFPFFFSLPGGALPPPDDPSGLVPIPIIPLSDRDS